MPLWLMTAEAVAAALFLLLCLAVALVVRRRLLARHGGTFELSYRARSSKPGRGWVLGIGRYSGDELQWFRIFSLAPRPRRTWSREALTYVGRRAPEGSEQVSLFPGHIVVTCSTGAGQIELAMGAASLTGFQSWLEAGPPGAEIR